MQIFQLGFSFNRSRITSSLARLQVKNFHHNFHHNKPLISRGVGYQDLQRHRAAGVQAAFSVKF